MEVVNGEHHFVAMAQTLSDRVPKIPVLAKIPAWELMLVTQVEEVVKEGSPEEQRALQGLSTQD